MSKTPKCPNCNSTDTVELNIHDEMWCCACGSWWWAKDRGTVHVPRRSMAETVDPDVEKLLRAENERLLDRIKQLLAGNVGVP